MILLWIIRFFIFNLYESPKYLMGRGRDADAIKILNKLAAYNGSVNNLTLEQLQKSGVVAGTESEVENAVVDSSVIGVIKRNLEHMKGEHVKSLFATKKLALSTSLLIVLWAFIGLGFSLYNAFLPFFLQTRGADFGDGSVYITYRNVRTPISHYGDPPVDKSPSVCSKSFCLWSVSRGPCSRDGWSSFHSLDVKEPSQSRLVSLVEPISRPIDG